MDRLHRLSRNEYLAMDTLITMERRQQLMKSVIGSSDKRSKEIESIVRKYDKPRLSKKDTETISTDYEGLEEKQSKSIHLHNVCLITFCTLHYTLIFSADIYTCSRQSYYIQETVLHR